jgi:hypothetical protein
MTRRANMADQITIARHVFNVPIRYEEGHELTANEASALNQTYHENLRNNFAKKVEEVADGGTLSGDQLGALQEQLDAYAEEYEFGMRTGGGGTRDPIMSEAMKIARDKVREALRKKNIKLKDVDASRITELAKKVLDKYPDIMVLAKQRVEEAQAAASGDLDDLIAAA